MKRGDSMMVPHISISGYAGAGKTTISRMLAARHQTIWVPRITCRKQRTAKTKPLQMIGATFQLEQFSLEGEEIPHTEYTFISKPEFFLWVREGRFLEWHTLGEKEDGLTGILRPEYWPKPVEDSELLLSVFGSHAPEVRSVYPELGIITVFLDISDTDTLKQRIFSRTQGGILAERNRKNMKYRRENIAQHFEHIVLSETCPDDTVEEIERIAGLTSPSNRRLICTP